MNQGETIASNFIWRLLERCGAQGVSLIVSIILARLLTPEIYGIIAIVTVLTSILQVFIDSGLGVALIQKQDADSIDFSSVFYFNLLLCTVLYIVLFLLSPTIATLYKMPELKNVLRVLGITLLISGFKNIQQAYVSRTMQFKRFFFATLGGTVAAAICGIVMAYKGCGVWALVTQQIVNTLIDTCILWITVKWRPTKEFSYARLKGLLSYGWKLLVSSLINTVYNDIRQLIIGKLYSSADLAYYNQGKKYTQVIITSINTSIDSVLLPAMSNVQDSKETVKDLTRRSIKLSTYVIAPLMFGMAACSKEIVSVILTDKWLPCVPYLIVFCLTYLFWPIHTANLNAIKAMGRSDLFLKLEIVKIVFGLITLFSTLWISPLAMAIGMAINSIIGQLINSWPNKTLLNYGYKEQVKDLVPNISIALVMGLFVWAMSLALPVSNMIKLPIQILAGVIIYLVLSVIFKNESFYYLWSIVHRFAKKEK